MKIENIKPIPQKILDKIYKWDCCVGPAFNINRNFFSYLTSNDGELVKVTVATRFTKDRWFCKQVAVHGIHSTVCFVKDVAFYYIGGYVVGWHEQGLSNKMASYEGDWGVIDDEKYFDPFAPCVNPEYALRFKKYRYSAIDHYKGTDILKVLRLYEQYPQIELFIKFGMQNLAASKQILKKTTKDKNFRKWLIANKATLSSVYYTAATVLEAYKKGTDLDETRYFREWRNSALSGYSGERLKKYFSKDEFLTLFQYLRKKQTTLVNYMDYLTACVFLGLDISQKQTRYPYDFAKWHDKRIQQKQDIEKAKRDAERLEKLKNFANVVEKYLPLQYTKGRNFIAVIATSPEALVQEGEALHHCVGRMSYDIKFAQEETLIFFVREVAKPDTPFVTVEYSPTKHKIIQIHGDHNSMPDETTEHFIRKTWLPYANKQIRQMQLAA